MVLDRDVTFLKTHLAEALAAAALRAAPSVEPPLRNAITGIAGCCARAASGQAAAPPSSVMNFRRLTR
jgi:hypothetical protein